MFTIKKESCIQDEYAQYSRDWARAITPSIRRIEEIFIEYGGSLRSPPRFIE